jgi:hypothetical protein
MKRFSALLPFLLACGGRVDSGDSGAPFDGSTRDADAGFGEACEQSLAQSSCINDELHVSEACLSFDCVDLCNAKHCGRPSAQVNGGCQSSSTVIDCSYFNSPVPGRRPDGLRERATRVSNDVGGWLAEAARMEAASVQAFRFLVSDLESHGAPGRLRRGAERSARDEIRHTDLMLREMKLHGGRYEPPNVDAHANRTLEAIAIENAVEGCVGESAAALIAAWQARHARDATMRRAMTTIAEDEARHADLAWEIHAWVLPRLDETAQERVHEAMRDASRRALRTPSFAARDPEGLLGLPDEATAAILVARLDAALWRAA